MPPIYPRSPIALADARAVVVAWAFLLLLGVNLLAHMWLRPANEVLLPINFALFAVAAVAHLVLSFRHKCPACGKHPTVQGFTPPHSVSVGQSRLSGWGGVIVNVIRRRRLVCIHCGEKYRIQ